MFHPDLAPSWVWMLLLRSLTWDIPVFRLIIKWKVGPLLSPPRIFVRMFFCWMYVSFFLEPYIYGPTTWKKTSRKWCGLVLCVFLFGQRPALRQNPSTLHCHFWNALDWTQSESQWAPRRVSGISPRRHGAPNTSAGFGNKKCENHHRTLWVLDLFDKTGFKTGSPNH